VDGGAPHGGLIGDLALGRSRQAKSGCCRNAAALGSRSGERALGAGAFGVVEATWTKTSSPSLPFRPELLLRPCGGLAYIHVCFPLGRMPGGHAMWLGQTSIHADALFWTVPRAWANITTFRQRRWSMVSSCQRFAAVCPATLHVSCAMARRHFLAGNVLFPCANCDSGRRKPDNEHQLSKRVPGTAGTAAK